MRKDENKSVNLYTQERSKEKTNAQRHTQTIYTSLETQSSRQQSNSFDGIYLPIRIPAWPGYINCKTKTFQVAMAVNQNSPSY